MALTSCYWFHELSEILAVHGDDITADGTGKSFLPNDVIFVYDAAGKLYMYCCIGYSVSPVSDLPRKFTGAENTTNGYPLFSWMNLDWTTTAIELSPMTAAACADSDITADVCSLMDDLAGGYQAPIFHQTREIVSTPVDIVRVTDENTESDWTEEALAEFTWNADDVRFDGTVGAGYPLALEYTTSSLLGGFSGAYAIAPLNDPNLFIAAHDSNNNVSVFERNTSTSEYTILSTGTLPSGYTNIYGGTHANTFLCQGDADLFVCADYTYTGSKTSQGVVFLFTLDTDGTFLSTVAIAPPVPARNGEFGRHVAIGHCVDSQYGADTHILVSNLGEEILALRASSGYTAIRQTIAFDRNDYVYGIAMGNGTAVYWFWDDSAGFYSATFLYYSGTYWAPVATDLISVTLPLKASFFNADTLVTSSGSTGKIIQITGSGRTVLQTWVAATYGVLYCSSGGVTLLDSGYFATMWNTGVMYINHYDIDLDVLTMDVLNISGVSSSTFSFCCAEQTDGSVLVVNLDGYTIRAYLGSAGASASYSIGHWTMSTSAAASRISLPTNVSAITAASFDVVDTTNTTVKFALSFDSGSTWYSYTSSALNLLSSLSDLKTVADSTNDLFFAALSLVNLSVNKTIDVAVAMERNASTPTTETPILSGFTVTYTTTSGDLVITNQDGTANIGIKDDRETAGTFTIDQDNSGTTFLLSGRKSK